jgi:inner membrane protein
LYAVGLSLLPDVDAVVGIAAGDLGRFHNNLTHSLFVALGVALIAGGLASLGRHLPLWLARLAESMPGFGRAFWLALVCYGAHVALDWMTYGKGVMAFWPLTDRRFSSPITVFYGLRWSEGIWSSHHLVTVLTELGIVGAVAILGVVIARMRRPGDAEGTLQRSCTGTVKR